MGLKKITSSMSLGRKILISIVLLMSISIATTVFLVNSAVEKEAKEDLLLDLEQAQTIFLSFLTTQGKESALKNRLLTKISFVRALVMGKNAEAIGQFAKDTLKNTQSDLVMFTDGGGKILARTDRDAFGEDLSGFPSVNEAMQGNKGLGLLIEGSEVYQVNSLPIKAGPSVQGTISLGSKIDDHYVTRITEMAKSKISFISNGVVIASVWGRKERNDLKGRLSGLTGLIQETIRTGRPSTPFDMKIGSETFTSVLLSMQEGAQESGGIYLIQISKDKAMLIRDNLQRLMLIIGLVALLIAIPVSVLIARQISVPISTLVDVSNAIAKGDFSDSEAVDRMRDERGDEVGILANRFSNMISNLKTKEARRIEMARMSAMVEHSTSNIMFADIDFNLTYMNLASTQTMHKLQSHIPMPVGEMIGSSIDAFHRNPQQIRDILSDANNLPYKVQVSIGGEHLALTAIAVYDENQVRIGTMVDWAVVTADVEIKRTISETSASLTAASEELFSASQEMTVNSKETNRKAQSVSIASNTANQSVQSIAAASEEMSVTIKEISRNVQDTSQITSRAVGMANDTTETIMKLGASSVEIGEVIKVISAIAEQTNLLALNATIEASRAGKAGKGFAVVANEVKELAKGTAKATEEISEQIVTIQADTKNAVAAIEEIGSVIGQINEISLSVSGAIEEQSATTAEITRSIAEAAQGTDGIVEEINIISEVSQNTAEGANNVLESSQSLSDLSNRLTIAMQSLET